MAKTAISREYTSEWRPEDEPYYQMYDEKNVKLHTEYKKLAERKKNVIFDGRLVEYKYNMYQAVAAVKIKTENGGN